MKTIKIFLASSAELVEDRRAFEIFLNRRNKTLVQEGFFLELVVWEDFLDTVSSTRLQDEYNKAIQQCDIFIMLFYSKVGKYTLEEFMIAYKQFIKTDKPLIYTYCKDVPDDLEVQKSLGEFKNFLSNLGHFYTLYQNTDKLQLHFMEQLEKLKKKEDLFGTSDSDATSKGAADTPVTPPSASPNIINDLRIEIANGEDVSKLLEKHRDELLALKADIGTELIMLQGRATRLEKDARMGLRSSGDIGVDRAKLNATFLAILEDISNSIS